MSCWEREHVEYDHLLCAIQGKAATGCAKHKSNSENSISSAGKMKTAFKCVPTKENNHLELKLTLVEHLGRMICSQHLFIYF